MFFNRNISLMSQCRYKFIQLSYIIRMMMIRILSQCFKDRAVAGLLP